MEDVERTAACRLADWHSNRAMRDAFVRPERSGSGEELRLRLTEGDVVLGEVPGTTYWSVTMHWRGGYGSRVLHVGTWRDAMTRLLEVQAFGPVGGPEYRPGPLNWTQFDDTERASVPQGELVIVRCSDQSLLFHVAPSGAFRFLGVGSQEQLRQTALYRLGVYCSKPVCVTLAGQQVPLRFAGIAGVLGFRAGDAVQEAIYLAYLGDGECAVLSMTGILARLSLGALAGEQPPNGSREPLSSGDEEGAEPPAPERRSDHGQPVASSPTGLLPSIGECRDEAVREAEGDDVLPRHFKAVERNCRRGDGKVRARQCLALLTEAWRREAPSFHGTRVQCYRALCEFLGVEPCGSERSMRDALALIARYTRFVCRDGSGQWWLPFEEVRLSGSALMRWIRSNTPLVADESWIFPYEGELEAATATFPDTMEEEHGGAGEVSVAQAEQPPLPSVPAQVRPPSEMLRGEQDREMDDFKQASTRIFRSLLRAYQPFQPLYGSTLGDLVVARGPPSSV